MKILPLLMHYYRRTTEYLMFYKYIMRIGVCVCIYIKIRPEHSDAL